MEAPIIFMFHRVIVDDKQNINPYYFKRGMVHHLDKLITHVENLRKEGKAFGSILQALSSPKYFHLSFDDGFKEHIQVARLLKEKFNPPHKGLSFSINVGNSLQEQYTGMDLIYAIMHQNKMEKFATYLQQDLQTKSIDEIKKIIASMDPDELIGLSNHFSELHPYLKTVFLNGDEVIELSRLFTITSHGVTHRFLTNHQEQVFEEMKKSRQQLEGLCDCEVDTFCYPEGKNDEQLRAQCKLAGYANALSIRHEIDNEFCIGRKII